MRSRKFTLIFIDLCLIFIAYVLAFNIRYDNIDQRNWDAFVSLSPWILLIGLFFITMYELYTLERKSKWDIFRKVVVSSTLMMLFTMAASFLFREFALPRSVILIAYIFIIVLLNSWKLIHLLFLSKQTGKVLGEIILVDHVLISHKIPTKLKSNIISHSVEVEKTVYIVPDF
ncbi:hypothetical protein RhiirA1_483655 [Rhizophagus irregularis]|uniref:Uncharacterized protein n=1 Tax=Rhizophagus irregularis TaxID=588596 RepID=A0A2N0QKA9_9GLOM|nr:hypothetical protein RhiirA1_483655 [Rhizophagus irregularis]